ncbi:MAG: LacI family transcriptional regulator [Clostridiales bacterium]|jgi:DNA-binding LacI/PurR family transcriptional regulator|nr:LacI family transcriptional regulator [Clostridiales bacterium]
MVKIHDVAKKAGVSVSTVSRAFRQDVSINEETRQQILTIARESGYAPNLLARGLKSSTTKTVGVIGSIDTPFYVDIIKGIETELLKLGYHMLIGLSVTTPDIERYYLEYMAGSQVAGIILMPFADENAAYIKQLYKRNVKIIQVFRYPYDFLDSVVVDDEQGAYLAASELLGRGHTRILLADVPVSFAYQRSAGYRKAFRERGVEPNPDLIVPFKSPDLDLLHALMQKLRPTAVITGVHDHGKMVVRYAQKHHLDIPKDLSVIMFDNVEWMEMMRMDAIAQPVDYIGVTASRLLADRIADADYITQPVSLVLQPRLIKRGSIREIS